MVRLVEVARRVYNELVRRRAVVKTVVARERELAERPIFVVGPYRSGTTLLRYILDSHRRICCPPETDFIQDLERLFENPVSMAGLKDMGYDEEQVLARLRAFVVYMFENYAAAHEKPRWADKTPAYVDNLPFIRALFPEAQFVIIARHGLDVADSHTKGGTFLHPPLEPTHRPDADLRLTGVRYWVAQMEKVLAFEAEHPEACFRVRYEEMCERPEPVLRRMFDFLGEAWDDGVLAFYDKRHDLGREAGRPAATRGFVVSKDRFLQWPEDLREEALATARPMLKKLGYSA